MVPCRLLSLEQLKSQLFLSDNKSCHHIREEFCTPLFYTNLVTSKIY
jgi:hypothetical protein